MRRLREHEKLGLIIFEDLGLEFAMRFDRHVGLGERINVQVTFADPRQEMIRFKEVLAAVEEEKTEEKTEEKAEETKTERAEEPVEVE